MGEHLPMDRAWILIHEGSHLSIGEAEHLETCSDCKEFLRSFVSVARYVGLSAHFPGIDDAGDQERAA
jgi:hypothetical protein